MLSLPLEPFSRPHLHVILQALLWHIMLAFTMHMQTQLAVLASAISNTLWAFASLNHHPGPMLLKVLQRELVHKLRQFTPQGIENVLWAFATLGHHPGQSQRLANCSTVICTSTPAIQFAFCQNPHPCNASKASSAVYLLLKSVLPAVHISRRRPLSSTTRTTTPAGDEVLAAAASHVHSILHQFNQQNLALTLWAFAKLAWCPPTDLLSDAASLAVASLHTSNSQNLSNTLWAFATLGFMPQAGLLEVCQALASCPGVISLLVMESASSPGCSRGM